MLVPAAAVRMRVTNTGQIDEPRFFLFGTHFVNAGIAYKQLIVMSPANNQMILFVVVGSLSNPPAMSTPNPLTSSVTIETAITGKKITPSV